MNASKELARLFEVERLERAPEGARREAWQRLEGALAANAPALGVGTGPLKVGLSVLGKGFVVTSVTALALGGVSWSLAPHAPEEPPPATYAAVATTRGAPETSPAAPASVREPLPAPPKPQSSNQAPIAKRLADSTFDEELRLIQLAKTELDVGQARRAESWLAEHESRFPNGVFAAERGALRVLAGCATLADAGAKRARGAEFARQNPRSPFLDRVLRACGSVAQEQTPSRATFEIDEGGK
jgi:hypothetical protein